MLGIILWPTGAVISENTNYLYLAQWEWFTESDGNSYWRCPGGDCLGLVDLRSIPQMSKAGGVPEGYGFFVYDKPKTIKNSILLGNDLNAVYNGKTILDFLWDKLTLEADPTGLTAMKPLMPNRNLDMELYLGGYSLVKSEKFDQSKHPLVLEVVKNDYRRMRQEDIDRGSDNYKRVLDAWQDKYKIDYRNFIPKDLPDEGKLKHQTTITDNFNRANATALGASSEGWSWVEILGNIDITSNQADAVGGTGNTDYANFALSSDDHYAQANVWSSGTSDTDIAFRLENVSQYDHYVANDSNDNNRWELWKAIDAVNTSLGYSTTGWTTQAGRLIKGQADGSTITFDSDGVTKVSATDTAITGFLYTGISGYGSAGLYDNFEAGDSYLRAPTITNSGGATNISTSSALLMSELTDWGNTTTTVHIYWGDNDGVTTAGNWDTDVNLGEKTAKGTYSTAITTLSPSTTYYYRAYATNASGTDWADSTATFTTFTSILVPSARYDWVLGEPKIAMDNISSGTSTGIYALNNWSLGVPVVISSTTIAGEAPPVADNPDYGDVWIKSGKIEIKSGKLEIKN